MSERVSEKSRKKIRTELPFLPFFSIFWGVFCTYHTRRRGRRGGGVAGADPKKHTKPTFLNKSVPTQIVVVCKSQRGAKKEGRTSTFEPLRSKTKNQKTKPKKKNPKKKNQADTD